MVKALGWLFLWSFKEKASAVSYDTAFLYGLQPVEDTKYPKQETTRYMGGYYLRYCYRV